MRRRRVLFQMMVTSLLMLDLMRTMMMTLVRPVRQTPPVLGRPSPV